MPNSTLLCLQGNCTGQPTFDFDRPLEGPFPSGSCAILTPFALFFFQDTAGHNIWFDSLVLGLSRPADVRAAAMLFWEPSTNKTEETSQLWVTKVNFAGDRNPGSRAMWIKGARAMCSGAPASS